MITRLYIDNYKCFSNFTYEPQNLNLLIGKNGSGKTSIFDALLVLQQIAVKGIPVEGVLMVPSLNAWDQRELQTFELAISEGQNNYFYRLQIQHDLKTNQSVIKQESVTINDEKKITFNGETVNLYLSGNKSEDYVYPHTNKVSCLALIPEDEQFEGLLQFVALLDNILVISPNPADMIGGSSLELSKPDRKMEQLASWIRHLSQESFQAYSRLQELLKEGVLEGFRNLNLEKSTPTSRSLMFDFSFSQNGIDRTYSLHFSQLSDGQRMLVALYTIVSAMEDQNYILCIDEPENFISSREIQPWLRMIEDLVHNKNRQCFMVSHHPELLNHLADEHGTLLYREASGVVRSKKFECDHELLSPGETVARGWE